MASAKSLVHFMISIRLFVGSVIGSPNGPEGPLGLEAIGGAIAVIATGCASHHLAVDRVSVS